MVADEELTLAVIQADAGDVSSRDIGEDLLETAICSVPNLHASWMCRDKSVKHRVVEDAETSIFISQMMINRLIIVIKDQ